jgi:shikimate dehydrogenase
MSIITGKTKLLGVIGDPVEHSLSPVMHNAAIASMGLDYIYLAFPIKAEDLKTALAGFSAIALRGFNVTIPHKQAILPLLTEISPIAQKVGAANTIYPTASGWGGTNTDVLGFIAPLQPLKRNWQNISPLVLGNGGAARGVIVGLAELGCKNIKVIGRNREKLLEFKESLSLESEINIYTWEELGELISTTELLINTTPLGMYPLTEATPVEEELMKKLQPGAIAYDLIYTPTPTKFLKLAQQQGAIAIDGLEMLVQQGAEALKLWVGENPPVEIMRESLESRGKIRGVGV